MKHLAVSILFLSLSAFPLAGMQQQQPDPKVQEALQKAQAGDFNGAIAVLEPLKGQPGVHPGTLSLLGSLYLETGRFQDAMALLAPVADHEATGPLILRNAARAALAVGQTDKAEAWLRRAVASASSA